MDVEIALQGNLPALLPFVPVLQGGGEEAAVRKAVQLLRSDEQLNALENLLAFFASFVLEIPLIQQIMRWDMAVLQESPWYQEIEQQGRQKEAQEQLMTILQERFGDLSPELERLIQATDIQGLRELIKISVKTSSLEDFIQRMDSVLC